MAKKFHRSPVPQCFYIDSNLQKIPKRVSYLCIDFGAYSLLGLWVKLYWIWTLSLQTYLKVVFFFFVLYPHNTLTLWVYQKGEASGFCDNNTVLNRQLVAGKSL